MAHRKWPHLNGMQLIEEVQKWRRPGVFEVGILSGIHAERWPPANGIF
jgi:hypothetical protein